MSKNPMRTQPNEQLNTRFKQLAQQNTEGRNHLMHAISKGDIVNVLDILDQISTLTQDERFMLLKQQDEYGRNALGNAVIMKNQKVAKLILKQILTLTVKVKGKWCYLYRAVDKFGQTIDFYISKYRDTKVSNHFHLLMQRSLA